MVRYIELTIKVTNYLFLLHVTSHAANIVEVCILSFAANTHTGKKIHDYNYFGTVTVLLQFSNVFIQIQTRFSLFHDIYNRIFSSQGGFTNKIPKSYLISL